MTVIAMYQHCCVDKHFNEMSQNAETNLSVLGAQTAERAMGQWAVSRCTCCTVVALVGAF